MCYTVTYLTKRKVKYAKRAGAHEEEVKELEKQLEELTSGQPAMYHVSGFAHPRLLCFMREHAPRFELYRWGLIPSWVKDTAQAVTLGRQTLNARGETIFTKPAFRQAAHHRCLVLVDGFFEFFHFGKRTYPYHIRPRNDDVMALGGIRSTWNDPDTGQPLGTVSIVTTKANAMMSRIHNNPNAEGPRMPFIVPRELDALWLSHDASPEQILPLIGPYDEALLEAFTVAPLLGKQASPNTEVALHEYAYPELALL